MNTPPHIKLIKAHLVNGIQARFDVPMYFNMLTDEFIEPERLDDYLKKQKPMVYWASWEKHIKNKLLKTPITCKN